MSVSPERYFFRTWLPQIIGYAEMVDEETVLRKAWVKGDRSKTSVYYPGELISQLDDLTAPVRDDIDARLADCRPLALCIRSFLHSAETLWFAAEATMDVQSWGEGRQIAGAKGIFSSHEWRKLQDHARQLIVLARAAGFGSDHALIDDQGFTTRGPTIG